jgi:hypothetical protein
LAGGAGEEDSLPGGDSAILTFLSDRDGRFDAWIGQIDTGEFTNITNGRFQMLNTPNARMVGFSGDGAQVWFEQQVSARPFVWTLWIRPLLGGTPRRFVEGGLEPTWSPDGNSLIYHTNDLGDPKSPPPAVRGSSTTARHVVGARDAAYASTRITSVSGATPSWAIASAAAGLCMTAFNASMSGTSITTATRLGFCGSTNVRMLVTPSGPNSSCRFGERSQ